MNIIPGQVGSGSTSGQTTNSLLTDAFSAVNGETANPAVRQFQANLMICHLITQMENFWLAWCNVTWELGINIWYTFPHLEATSLAPLFVQSTSFVFGNIHSFITMISNLIGNKWMHPFILGLSLPLLFYYQLKITPNSTLILAALVNVVVAQTWSIASFLLPSSILLAYSIPLRELLAICLPIAIHHKVRGVNSGIWISIPPISWLWQSHLHIPLGTTTTYPTSLTRSTSSGTFIP